MSFNRAASIYVQVANFICRKILLKEWKEGEKIPDARELAMMLEVNPHSAEMAIEYLTSRNIVSGKEGIAIVETQAGGRAATLLKENFISSDLPVLAEKMRLLNMTIDDLREALKKINSKS